jgi:hypothetical protein
VKPLKPATREEIVGIGCGRAGSQQRQAVERFGRHDGLVRSTTSQHIRKPEDRSRSKNRSLPLGAQICVDQQRAFIDLGVDERQIGGEQAAVRIVDADDGQGFASVRVSLLRQLAANAA